MRLSALAFTAYFFLLGLFPQLDGSQFVRVGQLWQHFTEHRTEMTSVGERLNFLDFLYAHYLSSEKHEHPDRSQHEQLPFQHLGSATFVTLATVAGLPLTDPLLPGERPFLGYRNVFYPADFVAAISHPPSLA